MVDSNLGNRLRHRSGEWLSLRSHVRIKVKPSRTFLLLAGVALFGAIPTVDETMADGRATFLDAAGETARGTSPPLRQSAVTTSQIATDKLTDATAEERRARALVPPQKDGREAVEPQGQGARSDAEPPALAGNPLWELPLERLSVTRERPIFSASRRPPRPPPANVAPAPLRRPAKLVEPERPAVSLIGTVIGTDVQMGVFLETATHNVIRLRLGEEHQGWVLRLLKAREATLVKDAEQTLVLDPRSGEAPAVRGVSVTPLVPNSIGTVPTVNTADYVDEQPLPRGAQRQRN